MVFVEGLLVIFFSIIVIIIAGIAGFSIFSAFERKDKDKKRKKLVFKGSAGWLLFWLIIVPPIGYIWLIFGMKEEVVKD